MNKQSSLSFLLSNIDANDISHMLQDLPPALEIKEQQVVDNGHGSSSSSSDEGAGSNSNSGGNNNIQISAQHYYIPQESLIRVLTASQFDPQKFDENLENLAFTGDDANFLQQSFSNAVVETSSATSSLPYNKPWSGEYDFKVHIDSAKVTKKSMTWTYSERLNKLYCNIGTACPVNVSVTKLPPNNTFIRATPIYSKPEHATDIVTRCENHKKSREFDSDYSFPESAISHLIRCRHPRALYVDDPDTKRQSVIVPFEKPQAGSNITTFLFQFMCYSSCIGGAAKPLKIVLTLEQTGKILGRGLFEVKICACPGRDRTTDETKLLSEQQASISQLKSKKNISAAAKRENSQVVEPKIQQGNKRLKALKEIEVKSFSRVNGGDEEVFTLKVKGRKNFEILKKINDALEMQNSYYKMIQKVDSSSANVDEAAAKLPSSLEEFLESIDMSIYYNTFCKNKIRTMDALLNCAKETIANFICARDTKIIWDTVLKLKGTSEPTESAAASSSGGTSAAAPVAFKRNLRKKSSVEFTLRPTSAAGAAAQSIFDPTKKNSLLEYSKYNIKYSFDNDKK